MGKKLQDILNECIDAVLQGDEIEQCLARYPEYAQELEPLLRLAFATKRVSSSLEPRPEFKAATRYRFFSALSAKKQSRKPWLGLFRRHRFVLGDQSRWAFAMAATLLIFLSSAGMVYASSDAVPGDVLYPVKTATEQGQLFITYDEKARDGLYLRFAWRRLQELEALSLRKRAIPDHVLDKMAVYTGHVADRVGYYESEDVSEELLQLTSKQQKVLEAMSNMMPMGARHAFRKAMTSSEEGNKRALEAMQKLRMRMMMPSDEKDSPSLAPSPLPSPRSMRPPMSGRGGN